MVTLQDNAILAAYYAGFFDGEGSVGIYLIKDKRKGMGETRYPRLTVKLTNTYLPTIEVVLQHFGGSIENNLASTKHINWQDTYSWKVNAERAVTFLRWIYPYSTVKKEQIEIVLEYWDKTSHTRQNKYAEKDTAYLLETIERLKQLKRGR